MSLSRAFDWKLNIAVFVIVSLGLVTLLSGSSGLFYKQLIWSISGLALLFLMPFVNLRNFVSQRWFILGLFFLAIFLLLVTRIAGSAVHGNRSWIAVGPVQFQPSEFAKLALIIALSAFFSRRHIGIKRLEVIFSSFFYLALPVFLILLEPDLGSALILFGIWLGFLLASGLPPRYLLAALPFLLLVSVLVWNFGFQDYQRDRILALFSPETDPLGVNYSVIQSKIAIGSAGFFGKGFGQGAQARLGFLPEAQTDFIFSAFVEEWGIFGGLILLLAFAFMIWRIATIGAEAHGNFYKFFCLGAIFFFSSQFMVNVGSAIGFLPVIGVVFPFLSYGGSNLLTSFIIIAIIQSIASRTAI
jgi:rod shape determining protein RodA